MEKDLNFQDWVEFRISEKNQVQIMYNVVHNMRLNTISIATRTIAKPILT